MPPAAVGAYSFGPFRLDLASMQLLRDGVEPVPLTPKVFDTLLVLLRHRGRVVGKDELMKSVWGDTVVSEDSLSQSISILRRALGDDRNHAEYIATVARRGYRFIAPVEEIYETTAEDAAPSLPAPPAGASLTSPPAAISARTAGLVALAAALLGIGIGYLLAPAADGPSGPLQFTLEVPPGTTLRSGAVLSPDSRHILFVASDETGTTAIWVRPLNSAEPRRLPGTEDATRPFWSPDGQSIGFFAAGVLKRTSLENGTPQTLATVGLTPGGGSWSAGGEILYAGWRTGLFSIPASGGAPRTVTTLDAAGHERGHSLPQFLPDGRHYLFYIDAADPERTGTYVGALGSPERERLLDVGGVTFVRPDHLAYVRDSALLMHPFDVDTLSVRGEPWVLAGNVVPPIGDGTISGAPTGLLAYGGDSGGTRLVWYGRNGERLGAVDAPVPLHNPALSRDGRQLLASGGQDVWTVDLQRNAPARVAGGGRSPMPSPDGNELVFTADRQGGIAQIYRRAAGGAADELLLSTPENKIVNDWSPDGAFIVYVTTNARTSKDIWLLPMRGRDRTPQPYLVTPSNDIQARVSPDGRWLAYASDESGQWEVYVQSFPVPGHKRVVSVGGGASPHWRADGRELFYLSASRRIMAVAIDLNGSGRIDAPTPLFPVSVRGQLNSARSHYVPSPDGQRFLVDSVIPGRGDDVTFVVNWQDRAGS